MWRIGPMGFGCCACCLLAFAVCLMMYDRFFGDDDDIEELTAEAFDTRPAEAAELPVSSALIDLATQCVEQQLRRRPRMQGVLAPLRRIEQQHAQLKALCED